jgi:CRISPR-associated protein Cpf1
MRSIDEFCGQRNGYSRSITLRNKLIPVGKTQENLKRLNLLANDKKRADTYDEVKKLIDDFHRCFIQDVLNDKHLNWAPLADAIIKYQQIHDDKSKKTMQAEQMKMRKAVQKIFTEDPRFAKLFKKDLFEELLPQAIKNDESGIIKSKQDALIVFNKFSTYFTGFHENRKNMYSDEEKSTAIAYRLVNDNFPKFLANVSLYVFIKKQYPEIISNTKNALADYLSGVSLDKVFSVDYFNTVMTQKGIDFYNTIIGGIAAQTGTEKVKGFNEQINLFRQQLPDDEKKNLRGKMTVLFKQILSDHETASFIPEKFQNDQAVYEAVQQFYKNQVRNSISQIKTLFTEMKKIDSDSIEFTQIFVPQKELTAFSLDLTGGWNEITNAIYNGAVKKYGDPNAKESIAAKIKKETGKEMFSLAELQSVYNDYLQDHKDDQNNSCEEKKINFAKKYFSLQIKRNIKENDEIKEDVSVINQITDLYKLLDFDTSHSLREEKESAIPLKNFLDAVQDLFHYLKHVDYRGEAEKSSLFYSDFDEIIENLFEVIPLYNKVRNYVTQKVGEEEKYKLNFDCPTLADGWDENKEQANDSVLFMKDNLYYLGIINPRDKIKFDGPFDSDGKPCYKKMIYKLLPGPNKMLPKVFFSTKGRAQFNPPQSILDGYEAGLYKKGDEFDKKYCHQLIDWFKDAIKRHEDWSKFNFKFSETNSYDDISEFYREISHQGYKINLVNIPEEFIDKAVEDGKLFLFQIYNKDFAEKATGRKNMHTLYWESLFSEENLKDVVFKLNGQAELFYRSASVKKLQKHEVGSILLNRTTSDGKSIPDDVYRELFLYKNNRLKTKLSSATTILLESGTLVEKNAKMELIKDKHFTEDVYLFHCPITMNFKAPELTGFKFNERVRTYLKKDPSVKIIGLDRGERNLVYLSLINQKGEIELQKTLNLVEQDKGDKTVSVNYQDKLVTREGERTSARRNWQTIGNIKELKEGYLSAVIHEIAELMVKENAIVVMEDLNFGFKRGRFPVERQVYQKFEEMLIDKLNYLVFKERVSTEKGGVLNAYQLTDKVNTLSDVGKQCGWLFYIPAAYTSKIDPKTGFANLFMLKNLTNVEKKRNFFSKFESIRYDKKTDSFVFGFTYDSFGATPDYKKKWEVYTRGERVVYSPKERKTIIVSPTANLKAAFDAQNIVWNTEQNMCDEINSVSADRANIPFFDALYRAFSVTLQMRNSVPNTQEDYLLSPVMAADGTFFDSREEQCKGTKATLPIDADANGAYHIALKGLYLLRNDFALNEKGYIQGIKNVDWFEFAQQKKYLK